MQHNGSKILPAEKVLSVLSYFSMGIIGIILCLIARMSNKKLRYFLMYNVKQSVIIGVFLFIFGISVHLIFYIISQIHFLDFLVAVLNLILFLKIVTIYPLGMSFSFFQLCVFLLLVYITLGVCLGRNFYIFYLTEMTRKMMKNYKSAN